MHALPKCLWSLILERNGVVYCHLGSLQPWLWTCIRNSYIEWEKFDLKRVCVQRDLSTAQYISQELYSYICKKFLKWRKSFLHLNEFMSFLSVWKSVAMCLKITCWKLKRGKHSSLQCPSKTPYCISIDREPWARSNKQHSWTSASALPKNQLSENHIITTPNPFNALHS